MNPITNSGSQPLCLKNATKQNKIHLRTPINARYWDKQIMGKIWTKKWFRSNPARERLALNPIPKQATYKVGFQSNFFIKL